MRGAEFQCDSGMLLQGPAIGCPGALASAAQVCPIACGEQILSSLGVSSSASDEALNFGLIAVYIVGFKFLGYIAFKFLQHIKR